MSFVPALVADILQDALASFEIPPLRRPPTDLEDLLNLDPNESCNPIIDGVTPRLYQLMASVEIPDALETTVEDVSQRKVMDIQRWLCIARPQYYRTCAMSSLVSCWNYLFSRFGNGTSEPISVEQALGVVGVSPPFEKVKFAQLVNNDVLVDWFHALCEHFQVAGRARIFWKLHGKGATPDIGSQQAAQQLCAGLRRTDQAFVYHCYSHYMCPIGFEYAPSKPSDAYKPDLPETTEDLWVILGETAKSQPVFHVKKWEDIVLDISQQNPRFYDIRNTQLGVQTKALQDMRSPKNIGSNVHCLVLCERAN